MGSKNDGLKSDKDIIKLKKKTFRFDRKTCVFAGIKTRKEVPLTWMNMM
jgi:hypothetical protein